MTFIGSKHNAGIVGATRDRVGESPVWSVAEQALYWVDIEAPSIHRVNWVSLTQTTWNLP
jgi:sugar lactone lactonase YvrE